MPAKFVMKPVKIVLYVLELWLKLLTCFIIKVTLTSSSASAIFDMFSAGMSLSPGTLKHCVRQLQIE